jgi:hypothetical protein
VFRHDLQDALGGLGAGVLQDPLGGGVAGLEPHGARREHVCDEAAEMYRRKLHFKAKFEGS